jgi:hypothetical protein
MSTLCGTHIYRGAQWVETKQGTPHKQRFFATECFHALFLEIMQLLVEETNRYYHQYLEAAEERYS